MAFRVLVVAVVVLCWPSRDAAVPRPKSVVVDQGGGGDFLTIQEGVDAVIDGGTVNVMHGDYEGFVVTGKSVRVLGTPASALADGVRTTITTPLVIRGLSAQDAVVVVDIEAFNTGEDPRKFPESYQMVDNAGSIFFSHTFMGSFGIENCALVSIHRHVLGGRLRCSDSKVFVGESRFSSDVDVAVQVRGGSVSLNDVRVIRTEALSSSSFYPFPVVVTNGGTFYHDRKGNLVSPEPGPEVLVLDGVERIGGFNHMDLEYSDGTQIVMRAIADRDGLYAAVGVSLFRVMPLSTEFGEFWLDPGSAVFVTDKLLDGSSFPFHFELDTVVPIPDGLRPSRLTNQAFNNAPGANSLSGIPYVLQGLVVGADGVPVLTPPVFGML